VKSAISRHWVNVGTRERSRAAHGHTTPSAVRAMMTAELLQRIPRTTIVGSSQNRGPIKAAAKPESTGTTARLRELVSEHFFDEPRTLADVRESLSAKGWRYQLADLGTPVTRLVRRRQLRRIQASTGSRKVWQYSTY